METRHCLITFGLAVALALSAGPLSAQGTASPPQVSGSPPQAAGSRAEEQARKQEEKARTLAPYRRGFVEKKILEIEQAGGFSAVRGFTVVFGDIKSGSSVALGPAYGKTFGSGATLQAKTAYSIHNFKMAQVAAVSGPLATGRLVMKGRVRWQDAPRLAVYGLGPNPSRDVRADYTETMTEVSGQAVFRPVRVVRLDAGAGFERFDTGPTHNQPPVDAIFSGFPGVNADPDYLHSFGSAAIDLRDGEGYSRHGTLLRATLHDYRQQNTGPFSFQRVDGAVEQYLPVLHGNWVIYLGARASTTTAESGDSVPFFLMPTLGGSTLRGYGNYRFRGRHSLLLTAEYRWYAQEYLDGAIFYDAGKTVPNRRDLDFDGLKHSVGAGVRLHGPQTMILRVEVARGTEGVRFILAFSPVGG